MSVSSTDALVAVTGQTADFDTPFPLTGGATLPTWRLAYETYGTPNTDMSNAVLVCHALSGSHTRPDGLLKTPKKSAGGIIYRPRQTR